MCAYTVGLVHACVQTKKQSMCLCLTSLCILSAGSWCVFEAWLLLLPNLNKCLPHLPSSPQSIDCPDQLIAVCPPSLLCSVTDVDDGNDADGDHGNHDADDEDEHESHDDNHGGYDDGLQKVLPMGVQQI